MKTKYLMLSIAFTMLAIFSFAGTKTDTIKVYGNCGSCKMHIESAAKAAGAVEATWNKETKFLVVTFNDTKTSNEKIQQKIASVGYDTQDVKATDAAYKKLDQCCQYERPKPGTTLINKSSMDCSHASATCAKDCSSHASMECCKDGQACTKDGCCKTDMSCCKDSKATLDCCANGKCSGMN